jgi:hypothetical protein
MTRMIFRLFCAATAAASLGAVLTGSALAEVSSPPSQPPTLGSTQLPFGQTTASVAGLASAGISTGNTAFTIEAGTTSSTFPVPTFYPVANNKSIALDISPHGSPGDVGYGVVWYDICNTDVIAAPNAAQQCLHLGSRLSAQVIASAAYNAGASLLPLAWGMQNGGSLSTYLYMSTTGQIGITPGGSGAPYVDGGALNVKKNSAYNVEAGGITIDTGSDAQPELILAVDSAHSLASLQSASRNTSFTGFPLVLQPAGGAVGIGSNGGTVDTTLCRASPGTLEINNGTGCGTGGALSLTGLTASGNVNFTGIPTADPHVAGRLWSNGGVLTVSGG